MKNWYVAVSKSETAKSSEELKCARLRDLGLPESMKRRDLNGSTMVSFFRDNNVMIRDDAVMWL